MRMIIIFFSYILYIFFLTLFKNVISVPMTDYFYFSISFFFIYLSIYEINILPEVKNNNKI